MTAGAVLRALLGVGKRRQKSARTAPWRTRVSVRSCREPWVLCRVVRWDVTSEAMGYVRPVTFAARSGFEFLRAVSLRSGVGRCAKLCASPALRNRRGGAVRFVHTHAVQRWAVGKENEWWYQISGVLVFWFLFRTAVPPWEQAYLSGVRFS